MKKIKLLCFLTVKLEPIFSQYLSLNRSTPKTIVIIYSLTSTSVSYLEQKQLY